MGSGGGAKWQGLSAVSQRCLCLCAMFDVWGAPPEMQKRLFARNPQHEAPHQQRYRIHGQRSFPTSTGSLSSFSAPR